MTEAATATASATDSGAGTGETTAATTETTATETGGTTLLTGAEVPAAEGEAKPAANGADADAGTDDAAVLAAKKAAKKDEPKGETKEAKATDDKPTAEAKTDEPKTDKDAPAAEEAKPAGLPEDFDWRDLLTDPKNHERVSKFNSPDELVAWVREADQKLRKALFVPGKDSSDEDWAKYRKMIGVPPDYTGYQIEVAKDADEGDISRIDRLKKVAHANNWTPSQLASVLDYYAQEAAAIEKQETDRHVAYVKQLETDLGREWGPSYVKNRAVADAAWHRAFGDFAKEMAELKMADGNLLYNDSRVQRAFAKIGRQFGEAGIPGQIVPDSWVPTKGELERMQAEEGYVTGTDKELIAKVTEGYKRLYPAG